MALKTFDDGKAIPKTRQEKTPVKQKWIGRNWVVLVLGNLWNLGFSHILGGWNFLKFVETKRLPQIPNHQPEPYLCTE